MGAADTTGSSCWPFWAKLGFKLSCTVSELRVWKWGWKSLQMLKLHSALWRRRLLSALQPRLHAFLSWIHASFIFFPFFFLSQKNSKEIFREKGLGLGMRITETLKIGEREREREREICSKQTMIQKKCRRWDEVREWEEKERTPLE